MLGDRKKIGSKDMKLTIRKMANIAVFAALAAVFSQISIPIGPVPINLALLAVFAAGGMLSAAEAVFAVMLFLVLGAAGLPVFAGFNAGLGALFGPTGGYLIGYLPAAFFAGIFCKERRNFWRYAAGMLLGLAACYTLGTAWFVLSAKAEIWYALGVCVFPFLPGDAVKIALAALLSVKVRDALAYRAQE